VTPNTGCARDINLPYRPFPWVCESLIEGAMMEQIDGGPENISGVPRPRRRVPFGNPVSAPAVYQKYWRRGGLTRVAVALWVSAFVLALGLGVVLGIAISPHWTDKRFWHWTAFGLVVAIVCIIMIGGYVFYLGGEKIGPERRVPPTTGSGGYLRVPPTGTLAIPSSACCRAFSYLSPPQPS
jgi:hypothetical protein